MSSLDNKVQSLADKIYADGVEKAKNEANIILQEAEKKKEQIINEAQSQADRLLKQAKGEAEKSYSSAAAEIDMAATRALDALESKVTDLVNEKAVDKALAKLFSSKEDIYHIILEMAKAWAKDEGAEIATTDAKALNAYFMQEAKEVLQQGISIREVNGLEHSFELKPRDGGYKMLMGKEELKAYFKEFFRPTLREKLFREEAGDNL